MTNWPRGGYPAGDIPASELKPPPDSMISKSSMPATYTAAEVKVLTAKARRDAADEIAAAIEGARIERHWNIVALAAAGECASIAREIGSKESA